MERRERGRPTAAADPPPLDHAKQDPEGETRRAGKPQLRLDPVYRALVGPITDIGHELGDEAPARSSITRAYHLMQEAGVPPEEFPDLLGEAKALTRAHQAQITKKRANDGPLPRKNLMAYFFATLESLLSPDLHPPRQIGPPHMPEPRASRRGAREKTASQKVDPAEGCSKYTSGRYGHLVES